MPISSLSHRTAWLTAATLALVAIGFTLRFPINFVMHPPYLMDYNVYRFAAELVRSGNGARLYELAYAPGMYFKYGPIWAWLWLPLAYCPAQAGAILWSLGNVAWLVLTLLFAQRIAKAAGYPAPWWASAAAAILLVRLLTEEFGNGQANLWWAGLTAAFLWLELTKRHGRAALALALSIMVKLPSLLFVPYLLLSGRWKTGWRTLAWLFALLVIGAWGVDPTRAPWHLANAWRHITFSTAPEQAFRIGDQSLLALLGRLLTSDGYGLNLLALPRRATAVLAWLCSGALFAVIALPRLPRLSPSTRLALDGALVMILMVLASPAGWVPTYNMLLVPIVIAAACLTQTFRQRMVDGTALGCAGLVLLFSELTHNTLWRAAGMRTWKSESYVWLVFMIVPLMALCLWALLWRLRRLLARLPAPALSSSDTCDSCPTDTARPSTPQTTPPTRLEIPA